MRLLSAATAAVLVGASAPAPAVAHVGLDDAIAMVTMRVRRAPRDAALRLKRAELYRRRGKHELALRDLKVAKRVAPNNPTTDRLLGLTYFARGDHKPARAALDRYLARPPGHWRAFATRGRIHEAAGRHALAVADYDRAIRRRPQPDLFLARGRLQERAGDLDAAARGYTTGMKRAGGAVVLRLALIRVESARGRHARALRLIDEQLASVPVKADWRLRRARVYDDLGRRRAARRDRRSALAEASELFAARPSAFNRLTRARAYLALRRFRLAARDLRAVRRDAPQLDEIAALWQKLPPKFRRKKGTP